MNLLMQYPFARETMDRVNLRPFLRREYVAPSAKRQHRNRNIRFEARVTHTIRRKQK